MARVGWHRDRWRAGLPDEMRDPLRRPRGASGRQSQKGGGPVRVPLLLLCMALAAAGGWVIGDEQLQNGIGDWWDRQSTSWTATAPPAAPPPASPLLPTVTPQPLPATALPVQVVPQVEATPTPTAMPPTATPLPTPTPPPPATPLPTPTPTPTPIVPPHLRHLEHKEYMLELINAERVRAGVHPVVLGVNDAAQIKAESAVENCAGSYWSLDGLKPYMRYSLAGGYQSNGENGSGLHYCYSARDWVRAIGSVRAVINQRMQGLMASPGHRRNILDPSHRKVNIGMAWDRYNAAVYQHFEGDYVTYGTLPRLVDGRLELSGDFKNGATVTRDLDLGIQVYYDPPPRPLTRGQLARTYCYNYGATVAALRPPLPPGWSYPTHRFTHAASSACVDPHSIPADAAPPRSGAEAVILHDGAVLTSSLARPPTYTVPWITAQRWRADGQGFAVVADLRRVVDEHGPGVYTIMVWAKLMGDDNVVSEYSIFHEITPPDTYS